MFSGLVETQTEVLQVVPEPEGIRLCLRRPGTFDDVAIGDSIATNGCCLTVVGCDEEQFEFQAGRETLSLTNLGELTSKSQVNCERSLAFGARVGGHLVTGHIDGLAHLKQRDDQADWSNMIFTAPEPLLRQMVRKGCITLDGVSLTIVDVTESTFSVALIPHTLAVTTLGQLQVGDSVNVETDLMAKYVQRQLESQR